MSESRLSTTSARLRADFDHAFTRDQTSDAPAVLDLLLIRVESRGYALKLAEVEALHADRKLVAAPSPRPELLGLVSVRGVVAPVYDLAQLLGYAPERSARWLAQVRAAAPFAVAFSFFEHHLRAPLADLTQPRPGAANSALAHQSLRTDSGPLPVIDLQAIFENVARRPGAPGRREERP